MRKLIHIFISLCVAFHSVFPSFAQAETLTRSEYEECQTQNETDFKKAIQSTTLEALKDGLTHLDYQAIVRDQWRTHKLEEVIDGQVDLAMSQVRSETSWGELLKSLAYRDKAKKLATALAERVYRSNAMKTAIEEMSIGAGREIGKSIELSTADAKLPAQVCLRAFLGPRYGETVADAVVNDTSAAFVISPDNATASTSSAAIAANSSGAIAGAVILIVRRQLARMAQRLGQRVIGAVLGRVVAIVSGGIGVALIAKDVWDLRYGVLPVIAEEMKSQTTKNKVKDELALAIKQQISIQLEVLADNASESIIEIWRQFKQAHLKVLKIAEANAQFKEFVDTARPDQLARVDEVVAIALNKGGDEVIDQMMADGSLHRATVQLPDSGLQIARETQSINQALSWWDLAGDQLADVVRFGLHKKTQPGDFTRNSLQRVLNFNDTIVVNRLATVTQQSRDFLLDLGDEKLRQLARRLSLQDLNTLSSYMTRLSPQARQEVMSAVSENPEQMSVLGSDYVRRAVINSSDQLSAVKVMLRPDKGLNLNLIQSDFGLVWEQRIDPILMWSKYPLVIIAAGFFVLFLLLVLRRILFVPQRHATQKTTKEA